MSASTEKSNLKSVSCTCECGNVLDVPHVFEFGEWRYGVCDVFCPKCRRRSTGGNYKSGAVTSWITERDAAISQAEYERQCFESDMNEWYGRGNW